MIRIKHKGGFRSIDSFLKDAQDINRSIVNILHKYGSRGVLELSRMTPRDSTRTANSWSYLVVQKNGVMKLEFHNTNVNDGVPIAILIEHGHATRDGSWVNARPFIYRAINPIFNKIAKEIGREVARL